jgi:hypothetical protein
MSEKILTFLERVEMNLPVTAQEVFDQSVGGVIRQGRQSMETPKGESVRCLYRDPQGGACALGQCIPDSMYDRGMEDNDAQGVVDGGYMPISLERHLPLLNELQSAHDGGPGNDWLDYFKLAAKDIAHEFGLDWKF